MRDHVHYNSNVSLLTILTVHLMLFMETIKCKICKTNVISLHFLKYSWLAEIWKTFVNLQASEFTFCKEAA